MCRMGPVLLQTKACAKAHAGGRSPEQSSFDHIALPKCRDLYQNRCDSVTASLGHVTRPPCSGSGRTGYLKHPVRPLGYAPTTPTIALFVSNLSSIELLRCRKARSSGLFGSAAGAGTGMRIS
jgi:hypothetical protein